MNIVAGTADSLPAGLLFDMAHYRYRVFVEKLGWKLAPCGRLELDQFDRRDTLYVVAHSDDRGVLGVARLLPTNRPYLLAEAFPQLLGECMPPHSPTVWELSRFAAIDPDASLHEVPHFGASQDALALLDSAMWVAREAGAQSLVTVSPLGIERILRRAGIPSSRLAPPMHIGSHRLFACQIELGPARRRHAPAVTVA